MFQNNDRFENKKQFQINKNLGINKLKNNIKILTNFKNVEVLNKKIDVTTGKIGEFRDYGIYTIAEEPMFSISGERINTI
jgi:hypothetical protein